MKSVSWRSQTTSVERFADHKHILRNRVIGNILIALGVLSPVIGGIVQRLAQLHFVLYLSELVGVVLLFAGVLEVSRAPLPTAATRTGMVSREQS